MKLAAPVILTALLLLPSTASAAPLGTFEWVYDALLGTGSTFTVTNESAGVFQAVFVDLYRADTADPFQSIDLGSIESLGLAQNFETISDLVPTNLARAQLRLSFGGAALGVNLFASALTGDAQALLAGSVDIIYPDTPPEPVPEPPPLLLLGVGSAALAFFRRRSSSIAPNPPTEAV